MVDFLFDKQISMILNIESISVRIRRVKILAYSLK